MSFRFAIILLSVLCAAPLTQADLPATRPSTMPSGDAAVLHVAGKVPHPLSLSLDQLADLDHVTVTIPTHTGKSTYRGIPLETILKLAGLQFGDMASARSAAGMCLVVQGADGYKAVFSLAELDSQFLRHLVMLADQENGKPLDAAVGPLRIIAPDEAVHARWVHRVISLTVAEP
ncbi:MAG TPA: molybdopterin-dependent oxidoreductase [Tepidisphaeraceae bacterium]|jgi:DMSO/TMAO reductase YedYZ molybdopterin-dependent catalytic subunit|nr:molybdopterin-dependent oxidoreductase [Tepidisphaeraceae bacterium]